MPRKAMNPKKAAEFLEQLKKAGATITVIEKGEEPKTLEELKKASRLSKATLDSMAEGRQKADFTAWVAWTLHF